jgi:hypothetical protein
MNEFNYLGDVVCKPIRTHHMTKVMYLEIGRDATVKEYKFQYVDRGL